VSAVDDLARDYRAAFLRYLPRREEVALAQGYEIGRYAVASQISMLDLARVHHDILLEVLEGSAPEEAADVASAAADFFLEVLATYDMTQRGFPRPASPL
jgi:hypothetical protein